MRAFVAFPLPDHARTYLDDGLAILKRKNPGIRWIPANNLHVTLVFLGEVSDEQMHSAVDAIDESASHIAPIDSAVQHVGTFPPSGKPRVVFASLTKGLTEMGNLRTITMERLSSIAPIDRRPFKPHITLARCRRGSPVFRRADEVYDDPLEFTVDRIVLYESVLAPGGAHYISRHQAYLKA